MATRKPLDGWSQTGVETSPSGEEFIVWTNSDGDELALPKNKLLTREIVDLFALNGFMRRTGTVTENSEGSVTLEILPEEMEESSFDRIISTLTNGRDPDARAEIRVFQVREGKPLAFCAKFTPEEWEENELDLIRTSFGPGVYDVQAWSTSPKVDANGQAVKYGGRFACRAKQRVEIVPSIAPLKSDEQKGVGGIGQIAVLIQEMQRQNQEAMRQLLEANKPAVVDPFAQFERFARLQAMLNGGKKSSMQELLSELDALQQARETLGMGKTDGGKDDNSMMGMLREVMPLVQNLAARKQTQNLGGEPGQSETPALEFTPTPEQPQTDDDQMNLIIRATIKSLCKAAEKKEKVDAHADGLLKLLSMSDSGQGMIGVMELPTWFEVLQETQPEIAVLIEPQKEWFQKLRVKILELWNAQEEGGA